MTDEQLLSMYHKYKIKRRIVIIVILLIIAISVFLYFVIRNTSSKDKTIESTNTNVIKDEVAPEIKLNATNIDIMKGGDVDYLKYVDSVIDNIDGDLLEQINYTIIDTSIVGEQTIVYTVSDSSGNTSQEVIKVQILEESVEEKPQEEAPPKKEEPKKEETKPSTSSGTTNNTPKPNNPDPPSNNESTNNQTSKKIVKYFLFEDGYTMANVSEACASELKKTNRTGMCSPIQDEKGIYLGMKLVVE